MPTSILFQLEHGAVALNGVTNYVVLNCLQWKSPHLEMLASAAKQSFAVIYENELDQELIDYLERVHLQGAMSAVKLIIANDDQLYVFLDGQIPSSALPALESVWETALESDHSNPWRVGFASVDELYTGCSDCIFWPCAKDVLESHPLGLTEFMDSDARPLSNYNPSKDSSTSVHEMAKHLGPTQNEHKQLIDKYLPVSAKQEILRSCCIHALLTDGIRAHEITNLMVGAIFVSHYEYGLVVTRHKTLESQELAQSSQKSAALILSHIKLNDLSDGDFLFPSKYSPERPMSRRELELAIHPRVIEKHLSFLRKRHNECPEFATKDVASSIAHLMGHHSPGIVQHYLSAHQARRSISCLMANTNNPS